MIFNDHLSDTEHSPWNYVQSIPQVYIQCLVKDVKRWSVPCSAQEITDASCHVLTDKTLIKPGIGYFWDMCIRDPQFSLARLISVQKCLRDLLWDELVTKPETLPFSQTKLRMFKSILSLFLWNMFLRAAFPRSSSSGIFN